jgi:hypothetical protein
MSNARGFGCIGVALVASVAGSCDDSDSGSNSQAMVLDGAAGGPAVGGAHDGGAGDPSGRGPAAGDAGPGGACDLIPAAICETIARCTPFGIQVQFADLAACVGTYRRACVDATTAPGAVVPAGEQLTACLDAIPIANCRQLLTAPMAIEACRFAGSLAATTPCAFSSQCATGFCSRDGKACGTCAERLGMGIPCKDQEACASPLTCAGPMGDFRCVVTGPMGSPCDVAHPCAGGFYCTLYGLCAARKGEGQACDNRDACDSLRGLACNTFTHLCEPVESAMPGSACGVVMGKAQVCVGGSTCIEAAGTTGLCASPGSVGEPCGATASGRPCRMPAECIEGVCTVRQASACH